MDTLRRVIEILLGICQIIGSFVLLYCYLAVSHLLRKVDNIEKVIEKVIDAELQHHSTPQKKRRQYKRNFRI